MKKWLFASYLFLLLGLLPADVFAMEVTNLYSVAVPVSSQDPQERQQAFTQGLQEILIKLSGNPAIASSASLAPSLANPTPFVLGYTYQETSSDDTSDSQPSLILQIKFSEKRVRALFAKAGQQEWTENRPLVLVWLALENKEGRQLIGSDSTTSLPGLLRATAAKRGLPLMLPQMDLDDLNNVSLKDIWRPNTGILLKQAKRYQSEALLIGRLTEQDNLWQAVWILLFNGSRLEWTVTGANANQVIVQGIDKVIDTLAKQTMVSSKEIPASNQVLLTVNNVKSVTEYAKIVDHLRSIANVSQVEVLRMQPTSVVFAVNIMGKPEAFQKSLMKDKALRPVKGAKSNATNNTNLNYQWTR